ncbi:hypothetical protein YC2023_016993 [Brassica napus]
MEGKVFLRKYLICVILLLGQLHGYKSCVENERKALFDLKKYIISITEEEEFGLKADYSLLGQMTQRATAASGRGLRATRQAIVSSKSQLIQVQIQFLIPDRRERGWHEETNNQFAGFFDDVEGIPGFPLVATSSHLNYGRFHEPVGWRQGWFATQRHKITLYCLRWDSQEFLPSSEINVLELNRES